MKKKYILIVSLILAILTIGAVSASDDMDDMTAAADAEDTTIASVENDETISDGGDGQDVLEETKEIDMKVTDVPKTLKYNECISCNVNITNDDAKGTLELYIDDNEESRQYDVDGSFDEKCQYNSGITEFGSHILFVKYGGDANYADKILNFTFTVEDYDISVDESYGYASLASDYELYIDLPDEAEGKVVVTYKGIDYTTSAEPGYNVYVTIPSKELEYGRNNVTIHYIPREGSKFSEKTCNSSFNCIAEITGPQSEGYYGFGKVGEISLILPSNATGNLSIKINGEEYKNITLVNGKASFSLNDIPCGKDYTFEAKYVGDDYTVDDGNFYGIDINPDVVIPEYVYSGNANYTIVITLPENTTGQLLVSKNSNPIYSNNTAKGVITISTATENSEIIVNYEAGSYVFINKYDVTVRDTNPKFEMNVTVTYDKVLKGNSFEVVINIPENIISDLKGTFTFFVDDVKVDEENPCYYTYLDFNTDSLDIGTHTWRVEYSDDDYYSADAKSGSFEVTYIDIDIPEVINYTHDESASFIYIHSMNNLTGMAVLYIDGKEYDSCFIQNGETGYIYITDVAAGKHDFEVKYEGNYPSVSQKAQVTIDYVFKIYSYNSEYAYGEPIILYGYLPEFMTGNVVFSVGGKNYTAKVDGYYAVTITDLAQGEYTAIATYIDDSRYPSKTSNFTFKVEGYAILMPEIDGNGMYCGDDIAVILTLPENATGTLFVKLNDAEYKNVTLIKGKASISLKDVAPGTYNIEASYNGTDYSVENLIKNDFTVDILVDYPYYDVELNEKSWVYIRLPADAKGNITIDMGEFGKQNLTPTNGIINFTLPTSKLGGYSFTLNYTGDDYPEIKFEEFNYETGEMDLIEYYVSVIPANFEYPYEDEASDNNISFTLPEDAKGKLSIYKETLEGDYIFVTQFNVTGPNVSVSLDMMEPGDYKLKIAYEDEKYGNFSVDKMVSITKQIPSISISNSGNDKTAVFTFELPKNATGSLIVKIEGKSYYVPINNGVATLTVNNLASGNHNISVSYSGDKNYSDTTVSKVVTVASSVPAKIVANDMTVYYTAGSKYSITVYAEGGALAANVAVVIKINGKKVATVKTNDKGVATYNIVQIPGSYKITAEALGKTITKKLTVKHIVTLKTVKVKKSAKKLVLTATVKVGKKAVAKKKVTFKFNGKKYVAKTNKKGVAKVTIKKKVLKKLKVGKKVKYQATYLKDTVKKTVKVKK